MKNANLSDLMVSEAMDKRQVTLHVISNANCRLTWGANLVLNGVLCTSSVSGMSVCAGDAGGPLVAGSGTARTLVSTHNLNIIYFGQPIHPCVSEMA